MAVIDCNCSSPCVLREWDALALIAGECRVYVQTVVYAHYTRLSNTPWHIYPASTSNYLTGRRHLSLSAIFINDRKDLTTLSKIMTSSVRYLRSSESYLGSHN